MTIFGRCRLLKSSGKGAFADWKERKGGSEWSEECPVHGPKSNATAFSFDIEGRYHCFSCGAKGKGAIDLAMAVQKVGFQGGSHLPLRLRSTRTANTITNANIT
jgi:hypothetical protein